MQWYQIKEQSAGKKRLILSWYLYKIFGKNILYLIAFLVSFFTCIFAPKIRNYSKKYFKIINIKPSLFNCFRHIYSYANSLVDNILVLCGDFDQNNIVFENEDNRKELFKDVENKKGVFLICNHIGNVEIFQSYSYSNKTNINIFMSKAQGQIFTNFLDTIKIDFPATLLPVEDIGLNTGVELKENLNRGDIVFIAGDRLSQNNTKATKVMMFNKEISLPKGTFKLAKLMEVPTYFVSVLKENKKYRVYLEKQNDLSEEKLPGKFAKFMERVTLIHPFQFYNFYDYFNS